MDRSLFDKCLVFPDELIHGTFENTCVKCPGVAPGYANAQPPGCDKIADAPPPGLTTWANALRLPGGGGMGIAGIDWCINQESFTELKFSPTNSVFFS